MGTLFPQGADFGVGLGSEAAENIGADSEEDCTASLRFRLKPSSMGLSFLVSSNRIEVSARAARYLKNGLNGWKRTALAERDVLISPRQCDREIFGGAGLLRSKWRKRKDGWLVTVVLLNSRHCSGTGRVPPEDCLYQVSLECLPSEGFVRPYPEYGRPAWDREEEELAFLYRKKRGFAVGHGCAATWVADREDAAISVATEFMPCFEVPPVTTELPPGAGVDRRVLLIRFLASTEYDSDKKLELLSKFVDAYAAWVEREGSAIEHENAGFRKTAERIWKKMQGAVQRMRSSLALLREKPEVMECFRLANLAMLMQMVHSGAEFSGVAKSVGNVKFRSPDYFSDKCSQEWRPFQLAFQLLVLESVANRNSVYRDTVDLVWFPTGGGKTEAYLAVAAFEMFYRRMVFGDEGGGLAVIKRYTLRLLTAQQFQRVCTLICACEMIRRNMEKELGTEPFTSGLWVGASSTPNRFGKAYERYRELLEQERPENPFQLQKCPWCGTRIVPERREPEADMYGIDASPSHFRLYCPNSTCPFHEELPVRVIDEQLYRTPPSFLVATIDKFAQLSWSENPRAFFFGAGKGERLPPSLVIQDELHLVSGPLGTIAGLYEAALDTVMEHAGGKPKIIAATATTRNSARQARALYGRETELFPPSGMSAGDSWFLRETVDRPGRLYVGVMGQYHTPVTALVHTAAALVQAPVEVPLSEEAADGYWTQVIFHNSRRELGKTMILSQDDIPARTEVIATEAEKARNRLNPAEMSANIPGYMIPEILEKLGLHRGERGCIDMLPCTNMFSVGVDIQRLALMVVNGQPKTTSEYIQASSRVGRSRIPGLVVALYPAVKSRDRSIYEGFVAYHQALYRHVEPSSVTPFALPAMQRAMHAALVIVMRYCAGLLSNTDAGRFDRNSMNVSMALARLKKRIGAAAGEETEKAVKFLDECVERWDRIASSKRRAGGNPLVYDNRGMRQHPALLGPFEKRVAGRWDDPWRTLHSMRSVDTECKIHVMGEEI